MKSEDVDGQPNAEPALEMLEGIELSDLGDYDAQAGLAQFDATAAATAGSGAATVGIWVGIGGAGVLAVAAALSLGGESEGPRSAPARTPAAPTELSPASPNEGASEPRKVASDAPPKDPAPLLEPSQAQDPSPPPSPSPSASVGAREAKRAHRSDASPDAAVPGEELKMASEMRAALERDPARALRLAEEGERKFVGGMFGRERQGHAILALVALGRTNDAKARARSYLKNYPRGSQSDRIRAAIGEEADSPR